MTNFLSPVRDEKGRLAQVTPFILTYNEEPNIARCLEALAWASRILVVDSGSTDGTLELIAHFPTARVVHRSFDSHSRQANFALSLIDSPWVLSLDADYILTPEFQLALRAGEWDEHAAYFAPFRVCLRGRPLRRSLYPPRAVLYARAHASYEQDGHTQRLILAGRKPVLLPTPILHDDRKPHARWLQNQKDYAELEAEKLRTVPRARLDFVDRIRLARCVAPLVIVPYVLFICGSILDGRLGILYAWQRGYFEARLALCLIKNRLRMNPRRESAHPSAPVP